MFNLTYNPVPTIDKFHMSDKFFRGVMGPVRSGKSTGMCIEIMRRAMQQGAFDKVRRSRWCAIRNTYTELKDTTLKTWLMWFPEDYFGKMNRQDMIHYVKFNDIEMEMMFRALDRPKDVAKLLSMELTGAWVNEAREIPKVVIDTLGDRVGQYPPSVMGGCTWSGVMMDTNPPDEDHWWYKLAEEGEFDGVPLDESVWEFWRQPGGILEQGDGTFVVHPDAENTDNLNDGAEYYIRRLTGKSKDYIRVYYCGQYGFVIDGKPVIPEYIDAIHCSKEVLEPIPDLPIYVGIDFGLTPAAIFTQKLANGRWIWFDELCATDMGISRFADILGPILRGKYGEFEKYIYGDPAGEHRSETDEFTPFQILEKKNIPAVPAPTNDFMIRREAIAVPLQRLLDGKPGLMISPRCKMARKGLAGGYCYRRINVSGADRFADKPNKTMYSHPVEAGGYAMVGAGEGEAMISNSGIANIHIPGTGYDIVQQLKHQGERGGWMIA